MNFNFSSPARIVFGPGRSGEVGAIAKELGCKKAFLVFDEGIEKAGLVGGVEKSLIDAGLGVCRFSKILPNPTDEQVAEAAASAKEFGADIFVAVGGGSSIDAAKAADILMTNPGPIHKYEGPNMVKNPKLPLIAVPTTAGTSSEVTEVIALIDTAGKRKFVICGRNVGADFAVVDPELTLGLPASATAATGMDALTHAIESYVSLNSSPLTGFMSLEAVRHISKWLPAAVENGRDLEAREQMMIGCLKVGPAFNCADLGLVHGIAHTLSAHFGLAHGMANAAVLDYVCEYNIPAAGKKLADVAAAMGKAPEAGAAVEAIRELKKRVRIPTLSQLGVPADKAGFLAAEVMKEFVLTFNPRQGITEEDVRKIIEKAL